MSEIPFKVSARTARLIGSQNFSNAEGAIIELVKNCYDADAKHCVVLFDNRFATIPESLSEDDYRTFRANALITQYYELQEKPSKKEYVFANEPGQKKPSRNKEISQREIDLQALKEFFRAQTRLYIIDDGEGMTDKIIRDNWMVIGTNNKEEDIYTSKGRIKTGAKGIGRFALDRLGTYASMVTKPSGVKYPETPKDSGYLWEVDWARFEGGHKIIDDVTASLIDNAPLDYTVYVRSIIPAFAVEKDKIKIDTFKHGSAIEIKGLKESWEEYNVDKVYSSLEVLIPPKEERKFELYVISTAEPKKYGLVDPNICDDYDYKLTAEVDETGIAEITIFRNEYDLSKFQDAIFERPKMQPPKFQKKAFEDGFIKYKRKLSELLPGYQEIDADSVLDNIGPFEFTLYFMKSQTAQKDRERFLYKDFNAANRKAWLDEFGGVKLFRDNFRVRPYGESKGTAFDWLDLGSRAAASPAGIGKKGGGYRVRPNNVSGIINISRITNIKFEDKSSREGLQENKYFSVFTRLILSLIEEFENDRSYIAREFSEYYADTHQEEVTEERAEEILEKIAKSAKSKTPDEKKSEDEREKEILAKLVTQKKEEIEELKNEQLLLRILASNALTIASFTHELRSIEKNLVFRIDEAEIHFKKVVEPKKLANLPEHLDPFIMLSDIKNEDRKLREWLSYSLGTLRKDKRRRKELELNDRDCGQ